MNPRKVSVFGVGISVVGYATAVDAILAAARSKRGFSATALAVHGLVTSVTHPDLLRMVNALDLVCPDGQPVRWAMNAFHHTHLTDRIHGVLLAIGAAFDFWAGTKRQAPPWMQRSGLEWLFRLACEPRRLWARYLTTNSLFCLLFAYTFVKRKVLRT